MDDINVKMDEFFKEHSDPVSAAATTAGEGANQPQAPALDLRQLTARLRLIHLHKSPSERNKQAGDHPLFGRLNFAPNFNSNAIFTGASDGNILKLCMKTTHTLLS